MIVGEHRKLFHIPKKGTTVPNLGFLHLSLFGYVILGLGIALALSLVALKVQTARLQSVTADFEVFQNRVAALGKAAEERTKEKESRDKKLKESVDRENKRLRDSNTTLARQLRESRSGRSFVPPAPTGSASPNVATFDRAELESAIQRLDERVSGIIEKGDQAVIDLDSAKRWATER
jgi:hypothetical protein